MGCCHSRCSKELWRAARSWRSLALRDTIASLGRLMRATSPVLEKIFAATIVVACLVMLVRLGLGARRRQRFDTAAARWSRRIGARLDSIFTWNSVRRRARREADDAIRRARGGGDAGEWDGNVYRPKSFKKDRKIH